MARIGFIGASGLMGHGMARNLLAKGHSLTLAVHRNRDRVADLLAAGATEAASAKDVAAASDLVFICVTGSPQVEASVTGPNGLLAGAHAGVMSVDRTTSEAESTARPREPASRLVPGRVGPPMGSGWRPAAAFSGARLGWA